MNHPQNYTRAVSTGGKGGTYLTDTGAPLGPDALNSAGAIVVSGKRLFAVNVRLFESRFTVKDDSIDIALLRPAPIRFQCLISTTAILPKFHRLADL